MYVPPQFENVDDFNSYFLPAAAAILQGKNVKIVVDANGQPSLIATKESPSRLLSSPEFENVPTFVLSLLEKNNRLLEGKGPTLLKLLNHWNNQDVSFRGRFSTVINKDRGYGPAIVIYIDNLPKETPKEKLTTLFGLLQRLEKTASDSHLLEGIALCYCRGKGINKNWEKGIFYLRQAAEKFNGDACVKLYTSKGDKEFIEKIASFEGSQTLCKAARFLLKEKLPPFMR